MKEFLKELMRPKPIKWKQTIGIFIVFAIFSSTIWYSGYDRGYFDAVGSHPTFEEVVVPVIPEITTPPASAVDDVMQEATQVVYSEKFDCLNIAIAVVNVLESEGIKAAVVGMTFEDGGGHAIYIVPTTDEGWIYKEAQTGATILEPMPGGLYDGRKIVSVKMRAEVWIPQKDFYENPVLVADKSWLEEE